MRDSIDIYGESVTETPGETVIAEYTFDTASGVSTDSDSLTTAGTYSMACYNSASPGSAEFTSSINGLSLASGAATSSFDPDSNPTLSDALNTVDFTVQTHLHQFTSTSSPSPFLRQRPRL